MNSSLIDKQQYQAQLDEKITHLKSSFLEFNPPDLEVFPSPEQNYRMRTEFRVWHEGDDLYYIMFKQDTKEKYRVDTFPAAGSLINELMPKLLNAIKPIENLRRKLFQVDFLSTLTGEILISLLYHRQLDDEWEKNARRLKETFNDEGYKLDLIGRAHKQKKVMDKEYVHEKFTVNGRTLTYQQIENSFTQPNAVVAEKMLEWAHNCTKMSSGDLLELYCGNGNFSLALAPNFERVLATELAKPSVKSAQYNIKINNIENVKIIRMSAEEFTQAMDGQREFRRLKEADVDLKEYKCNTIFVDPPRSGMDEKTCKMVQAYERILYISCNPETLKENLITLSKTHKISRFALFDQFPYTHHVETGVMLELIR